MLLDLRHVPRDRPPPPDLPRIVGTPASHVVAAVPLKPAARVLSADPSLLPPNRERLRRGDAEEVEPSIVPRRRQFGAREPAGRKFGAAVGHVLPAECAELEDLLRRQLGPELRSEIPAHRFRSVMHVYPRCILSLTATFRFITPVSRTLLGCDRPHGNDREADDDRRNELVAELADDEMR